MEEKIYKREEYLKRIRGFYNSDMIKVITGIRRCGKSTFLKSVILELKEKGIPEKDIIYLELDKKEYISNEEYYDLAMKDGFESVFHKVKEGYEIQNEVRFAVINPDKPEHMELMLEKDLKLKFTLIPLRYEKDILIELSNLEFDDKLNLPIRFSSEIKYYESER